MQNIKVSLLVKVALISLVALTVALVLVSLEVQPQPRISEETFREHSLQLADDLGRTSNGGLHLAGVSAVLDEWDEVISGSVEVFDANWRPLYSNHDTVAGTAPLSDLDVAFKLHGSGPYFLVLPVRNNGEVVGYLRRSLSFEDAYGPRPLYNTLTPLRMGLAALAFFLIIYVATYRLRRDFRRILKAIDRIAADDLDVTPTVSSRDELGHLSKELAGMANRLKEARDQEKALVQARDELVAGVSHDLRTPLTSILGYSHLLQEKLPDATEDAKYARIIEQKAQRIKVLVDNLFDFTKLRLGETNLKKTEYDLKSLLQQSLFEYEPEFNAVGRAVVTAFPTVAVLVEADADLISRVVDNLLVNSLRHATGATRVEVELTIKREAQQRYAQVTVADDGQGIPAKQSKSIFTKFYRGGQSSNSGSGLGLSIAQEIIRLHDGRIYVNSDPGTRTAFTFLLPMN